ncbi:hypothetical protein CHS0354_008733 [Potamilus streckersoni]|uniref:Uncharacterized protein n=1 Tax=Potamilus streckersoni TaxID=2493646 RepID=A0AAE0WD41_9BIVA|nr:hypothetical protein CHS0354_008733 [Potamilus streckersoni]
MSGSDTDKKNVNGNFTVFTHSSCLGRNDTTMNARNAGHINCVVYRSVRVAIFFGGIFFIVFAGIGMYMARKRCRPEKYEDPLKI